MCKIFEGNIMYRVQRSEIYQLVLLQAISHKHYKVLTVPGSWQGLWTLPLLGVPTRPPFPQQPVYQDRLSQCETTITTKKQQPKMYLKKGTILNTNHFGSMVCRTLFFCSPFCRSQLLPQSLLDKYILTNLRISWLRKNMGSRIG